MRSYRTTYSTPSRHDHITINETYEVQCLAERFAFPIKLVENIVKQEGPKRSNIEAYLARMKRNGR